MRGVMRTRFLWDSTRDSFLLSEAQGPRIFPPTICLFATYSRAGCGAVGLGSLYRLYKTLDSIGQRRHCGVMSNILLPLSPLLRTLLLHITWHNLVWRGHLVGSGAAPLHLGLRSSGGSRHLDVRKKAVGWSAAGMYVCTAVWLSRGFVCCLSARSSCLITFWPWQVASRLGRWRRRDSTSTASQTQRNATPQKYLGPSGKLLPAMLH